MEEEKRDISRLSDDPTERHALLGGDLNNKHALVNGTPVQIFL